MAVKKNKKKRRKSPNKKRPDATLIKIVTGLLILFLLVIAAGFLTEHLLKSNVVKKKQTILKKARFDKPKRHKQPIFEIYPKEAIQPPVSRPKIKIGDELPKIAIIIDDLGYDKQIADKFLNMEANFTYSIFPYSPFKKKIISKARAKGVEIMLHLPMEPNEYPRVNPGTGVLLTSMSPDTLIEQLVKNLDDVPFVKGVNNHMGSKLTTRSEQMNQVFSILKKRGLYFIDSRTTKETKGLSSARLWKISFGQRDVFIDHIQENGFIRKQLLLLVNIAEKQGTAIGIAHPYELTYQVLKEMLPGLKKKVEFVSASKVVHQEG